MKLIYHLTTRDEWERGEEDGFYTPEGYEENGTLTAADVAGRVAFASKVYKGASPHRTYSKKTIWKTDRPGHFRSNR